MNSLWLLLLALLVSARSKRLRISCMAIAAAALPVAAHSADTSASESRRFYVAGTVAMVRSSVDAADMDARLAAKGYTTDTSLSGETRLGGMLDLGYRWRYLGFELGYAHLGELHSTVAGSTPIDAEYLRAISLAHPRSGMGPRFSALAYLPLGKRLELFGRAGIFYWRTTMSADARIRYDDVSERQTDPLFGLGVRLNLSRNFSAQIELERYRLDGEDVDLVGLGLVYRLPGF